MTSKYFIKQFYKKFEENRPNIEKGWFNREKHTENMTILINEIGIENYEVVNDGFWTLDCIFFKKRIITKGTWPKKLEVIVEHENKGCTSFEEMCKLCYWKANLKVLITYQFPNATEHNSENLRNKWTKIIKETDSANDNFIFIIAIDTKEGEQKNFEAFEWISEKKEFIFVENKFN